MLIRSGEQSQGFARIVGFAASALLWAGAPASAQMISPMLYNGPAISLQAHANSQRSAPTSPASHPAPSQAESAAGQPALSYRSDPARRRANLAHFVERMRAVDPQGGANLATLFAQGDIIERMRPLLATHGLDVNRLADAYAAYWLSAFQASRGDTGTPDRKTIEAVKLQAADTIGPRPELAMAGDATRQEIAESLLLQAMLLDSAVEGAQGKPDQLRLVHQAAVMGARKVGLDLDRMTLSPQGFAPAS